MSIPFIPFIRKVQGRHAFSAFGKDGGNRGASGHGNLRVEPGGGGGKAAPTGGDLIGRYTCIRPGN